MKNFRYALCALAAASATVACSGDDTFDTPKKPADEAKFTVVVDNNVTRTSFTDGVGMQWDNDDHTRFGYIQSGVNGCTKASEIAIGEQTAVFTFNGLPSGDIWFLYTSSLNLSGGKHEFTISAAQTQDKPGAIGSGSLNFRSDIYPFEESATSAEPKMHLVGTLQRFLAYSPTGAYKDEAIQSIRMDAAENIAGLTGYNNAGEPVDENLVVQPSEIIYWDKKQSIVTTVANPAVVEAANREQTLGHGIYMAVAPVTVSAGYTYTITTDQATYTLVGPTARTFANGEILNIFVNLESEAVKRVGNDEVKGSLR
ncbi:MAG: hypothetical protein K2J51_08340 [Alistipes sp.]|nr:hypothetical protein [Alistipes sp.]